MLSKNPKCSIIAVHGIGIGEETSRAGFSKALQVGVGLSDDFWKESVWEGVNDSIDSRFVSWVAKQIGRISIGPVNWDRNLPVWSNLGRLLIWFIRGLIKVFGRDMAKAAFDLSDDYFLYLLSKQGARIRKKVKKDICDFHKRCNAEFVLVAHSLGSLIAYDVLAESALSGKPLPVKALVTFGSPIEWSFKVRRALHLKEREYQKIGDVVWRNYYYKEDLVPLHRQISDTRLSTVSNNDQCLIWHKDSNAPTIANGLVSHCDYWKDLELAVQIRNLAC